MYGRSSQVSSSSSSSVSWVSSRTSVQRTSPSVPPRLLLIENFVPLGMLRAQAAGKIQAIFQVKQVQLISEYIRQELKSRFPAG